jgi:hypothetical protein
VNHWIWKTAAALALAATTMVVGRMAGQQEQPHLAPLPERTGSLRKALLLLREGKAAESRKEVEDGRSARAAARYDQASRTLR